MSLNDWITLNVGGRQFETSRLTLVSCPDSLLATMFSLESSSPPSTVSTDGAFRIDADPDAFAVLLNWLRRKKLMMNDRTSLENVAIEAHAFGLDDLKDVVEQRKKEIKVELKKEIVEEERKRGIKEERSKEYKEKQQRKEDKEEDRRNAKKDEWMEEQKTTLTTPMSKLEKIGRSSKPDRAIGKKKILPRILPKPDRAIGKKKILPRILPKPMFKKKPSIISLKRQNGQQNFDDGIIESFAIRKSANQFAKTSFSNEVVSRMTSSTQSSATHSFDTAGCVEKASAAPPTRKLKEPSKVSKMDNDVEVLELKKPINNQEVTEAVPKVIKAELDENQNHEATILCGLCYKPFSKNAGALVAHGETHGGEYGGKGKRKCTQCIGFEGDRTRLLMHMRAKHTKEKLFKCEVCEDSFATCAAKKTHKKRH